MTNKPQAWVKYETLPDNGGRFLVSPLPGGMGTTIGNAIRRVLLSSLGGTAITSIRIEGITHEFSTIPDVVEDVLEIISNLKGVVFKAADTEEKLVTISKKGKGSITAKDIQVDSTIEVVNSTHHIAEVTGNVELTIELTLGAGFGYVSAQQNRNEEDPIDRIAIDSSFSPIVRVNHSVDNVRVGDELGFDCLVLDVWTNGSTTAEESVQAASEILKSNFELFNALNEQPQAEIEQENNEDEKLKQSALEMSVDDLELSARSSNCLKRAGIETVGALLEKDMSELIQIKNFGKKSADEINDKLKQYNLSLKE